MKIFLALIVSITFSFSTLADSHTLTCQKDSKEGPLQSFEISFETQYQYLDSATKFYYLKPVWDENIGISNQVIYPEDYVTVIRNFEVEIYIDFIDWATVGFKIGSDDHGAWAFVDFMSDGLQLVGFYRCEQTVE